MAETDTFWYIENRLGALAVSYFSRNRLLFDDSLPRFSDTGAFGHG